MLAEKKTIQQLGLRRYPWLAQHLLSKLLALWTGVLLCCAMPVIALPNEMTVRADWNVGDVLQYRFDQFHKKAGRDPVNLSFDVRLEVMRRSGQGHLVKMVVSPAEGVGAVDQMDAQMGIQQRLISRSVNAVEFIVQTDLDGAVEALQNWQEVSHLMLEALHQLKEQETWRPRHRMLDALMDRYRSEPGLRQHALSPFDLLFAPFGSVLTPGQWTRQSHVQDLAQMGRIKVSEQFLLQINKPVKGSVSHDYRASTQGKELLKVALPFIGKNIQPKDVRKLEAATMSDRTLHVLSGVSGVVHSVEHTREITMPGAKDPLWFEFLRITRKAD